MARDDPLHIERELADIFKRMAGVLFSEETLTSSLKLMADLAAETIPGAVGAGVTLFRDGEPFTAAHSDDVDLVQQADTLQYELGEGPCLDSARDGQSYRVDAMKDDDRWPRWAPQAFALGLQSSISVPLIVRDKPLGAAKVYSCDAYAFGEHEERVMQMFAGQAAIVLANVQSYLGARKVSDQLKAALETRDLIGKAIGILMEREGIDDDAAFERLSQTSQNENIKVAEIARRMVDHPDRGP